MNDVKNQSDDFADYKVVALVVKSCVGLKLLLEGILESLQLSLLDRLRALI